MKDVLRPPWIHRWGKRLNLLSDAIWILESRLVPKRTKVVYRPVIVKIVIIDKLVRNVWHSLDLCKLWVATIPVIRWLYSNLGVKLSLFPWSWQSRKSTFKTVCIIERRWLHGSRINRLLGFIWALRYHHLILLSLLTFRNLPERLLLALRKPTFWSICNNAGRSGIRWWQHDRLGVLSQECILLSSLNLLVTFDFKLYKRYLVLEILVDKAVRFLFSYRFYYFALP